MQYAGSERHREPAGWLEALPDLGVAMLRPAVGFLPGVGPVVSAAAVVFAAAVELASGSSCRRTPGMQV